MCLVCLCIYVVCVCCVSVYNVCVVYVSVGMYMVYVCGVCYVHGVCSMSVCICTVCVVRPTVMRGGSSNVRGGAGGRKPL